MPERELTIPQSDFADCTAKYPLFIGGYGSGKTEAMILNIFEDLFQNPGMDIASYCPTYDLLTLNLMPRIEQLLEEMNIAYHVNRAKYIYTIKGHGKIIMRSMDNPARIIAYEVFRSHIDEIDTIPKDKAIELWRKIIGRNRQKSPKGEINTVRCYTTPDHGFESFTYSKWGKDAKKGYVFVRAPTLSNPHLPDDYEQSLRDDYPPALVEAFLKGEWVNMAGVGIFDTSKFKRWEALPNDISYARIYCDTAQKTKEQNDYSVFQYWVYSPSQGAFLVDQVRGKWEAPELRQKLIDFWTKHSEFDISKPYSLNSVKVEDKSSGTGLIQDIAKTTNIPIEGIPRFIDKVTRSLDILPQISVGNVHIPANAPWVSDYVEEFDNFTIEMSGHDDQIDPTIDAVKDMMIDAPLMYTEGML